MGEKAYSCRLVLDYSPTFATTLFIYLTITESRKPTDGFKLNLVTVKMPFPDYVDKNPKIIFFTDFDGTISNQDSCDWLVG